MILSPQITRFPPPVYLGMVGLGSYTWFSIAEAAPEPKAPPQIRSALYHGAAGTSILGNYDTGAPSNERAIPRWLGRNSHQLSC